MSDRVSPARRIALEVLTGVRERDAYANLLLPTLLARQKPSREDAAFATELAYGTLRLAGRYDAIIARAAGRPLDRIDPPVLDVLRLGSHQLLALRTARHAAVHQAVEQARAAAGRGAAGFANAVLRRVGERTADEWTALLTADVTDRFERAALATGHPAWVVRELDAALGTMADGGGDLDPLLEVDDAAPPVGLAALPGLAERGELLDGGGLPLRPHRLSPIGVELDGGDPGRIAAVAAGTVRVQDPGSQLAALALTRARPVRDGERWLDLCAGPGGKAALLAAEARLGGATVVANEITPARARLVERALAGVPGEHPVETGDGRRFADGERRFDRILLDAPCSGLGALRRRPEARWRKRPEDVPALAALQGELLDAAVAALVPGGLLAYVTCSPVVAETTEVVAAALERHPALRAVPTAPVVDRIADRRLQDAERGTAAQLWPHRHGTDAMFVQLLALEP
ncbi:RsmB/NOP family class I SAM-dependent RNA methyltransferase [Amnibacterium kyonggiense]|uniref:16S rRNA (Cytosine967-C5)-methyltransferase n=1 Tax=Amnibacterium kyonggiense TaxID=595671 RepID=A0A4R7FM29_9MICO|nr:transcription antitermination factor NusB [Amnibacterium kyonggiense]TDS77439.1 16S rRNA (cytosine967-C5)-methyltransferase [Amnibacterium kyonggiense]